MIDHRTVRSKLREQLLTVAGLPSARSWENRNFKPPTGEKWVRETYLPGDERQSANDMVEAVGVVQYDLYCPAGAGTEEIEDLADAIKEAFKPSSVVGSLVRIDRSERLPGRQEPKWYSVPVRVSWRVHGAL